MVPAVIKDANFVFMPAPGTEESVVPLPVCRTFDNDLNSHVITSEWAMSVEELARIVKTGRVHLHIIGEGMPPVLLTVPDETEMA